MILISFKAGVLLLYLRTETLETTTKQAGPRTKKPWLMKQKPMLGVFYALCPAAAFGIYSFGYRALAILLLSIILGTATEAVFTLRQKKPVTSAVLVTSMLYGLILPPSTPFWIAGLGIIFAVVFGKMVFGGFGGGFFSVDTVEPGGR